MTRTTGWALGLTGALLLCGLLALPIFAAGPHASGIHGEHFYGDGETVDLSELADGETRFFDAGDRQLIATRYGDVVEMTLEDPEDGDQVIECTIGRDRCLVFLPEDGGDARLLIATRRGTGVGDAAFGLFQADADVHGIHEGHEEILVELQRLGEDDDLVWVDDDEGSLPFGIQVHRIDETVLRCPEGDTTMTIGPDEDASGPYYCPKHDIELEKATDRVMVKEIRVQKPHEDR
ncbi:MAG: hypothetical protein PVF68_06885 [Acidobacteriota bacterium]|jgi:hypothetical protein